VHLKDSNIEVAFTHDSHYGESYYSFVNGQYTNDGGTHQQALREGFVKAIRDFYKKQFDVQDIRASIVAAISIGIVEPIFESQTKNKLGSTDMTPGGVKIKKFVDDFFSVHLNEYLHKNSEVANAILNRILQSEKERKEISGIRKLANEKSKKANLCNRKLRDCKYHDTDTRNKHTTQLFIVEGDSAAGSFTSARDPQTQAVFSLKGKPLNVIGLTKKICYENDELNLLQHALGIEDGFENLRYRDIVMATDADPDGQHIRLLLITFFAQFYPDIIEHGRLYTLITPLFRVRNNKKTIYCYDEAEKEKAIKSLGANPEITRFKGLGEISPDEFKGFISASTIKLQQVPWYGTCTKTLEFFMGKNTAERVDLISRYIKPEID
jgi:topoisomerase-4 subunit B